MTDAPDRERRRAADLRTGDRIVPNLLDPDAVEEVLGVYPFIDFLDVPSVLLVLRPSGRSHLFSSYLFAEQSVALAADSGAEVPAGVEGGPVVGRATVPEACNGDPCTLFHRHPHPAS